MNERYNFHMPAALHRRFKVACVEAGESMSVVLARIITHWLDQEPLDPQARLQQLLDKASRPK